MAFGSSAKKASQPEESTIFIPLDQAAQFYDIPFRNELNPSVRFDYLNLLAEREPGSVRFACGINNGLVVTAKVDLEKGSQGVAGDAVNLQNISGEIF